MRKTKFWLVLSLIATSLSIFACKKDTTSTAPVSLSLYLPIVSLYFFKMRVCPF